VFLLCALVTVYMLVMVVRAVFSWFPARRGGALSSINSILYDLTEPVLAPVRRVIPPAGMFDLSFIVVFFFLLILRSIICSL
jgi:YggT family protein